MYLCWSCNWIYCFIRWALIKEFHCFSSWFVLNYLNIDISTWPKLWRLASSTCARMHEPDWPYPATLTQWPGRVFPPASTTQHTSCYNTNTGRRSSKNHPNRSGNTNLHFHSYWFLIRNFIFNPKNISIQSTFSTLHDFTKSFPPKSVQTHCGFMGVVGHLCLWCCIDQWLRWRGGALEPHPSMQCSWSMWKWLISEFCS